MGERIILIGETHGRDLDRIRSVLDRFTEYTLAVEYPQRLQDEVQRFALSGNRDCLRDRFFAEHSYKATEAFLSLLVSLDHPVHCIDVDEDIDSDPRGSRQKAIAENIRMIDGPVIAILGAVNASKVPMVVSGIPVVPVGFYLYAECRTINATEHLLPGFDERV